MTLIRKISFIGIGSMGKPMAGRLANKGVELSVFDIRPDAGQAFVREHGGRAAASLTQAGHGAEAVIFMLPDDEMVRQGLFDGGLADQCAAPSLCFRAAAAGLNRSNSRKPKIS